MTDRDALHSMLIYAQREAEALKLCSVAALLSQAVADVEAARAPAGGHGDATAPRGDRMIRTDVSEDADFHGHFAPRRLQ